MVPRPSLPSCPSGVLPPARPAFKPRPPTRRQELHDNRGLWREDRTLRENLEAVLGLCLPQRQGGDADDASADCAICYAYRLLPEGGGTAATAAAAAAAAGAEQGDSGVGRTTRGAPGC